MKIKKGKKSVKMRGKKMGSHGGGARKNRKKSGHRGGKGLSGSGKRADHKKTLVIKKYGHSYFGKQGITSRGTARDTRKRINLYDIESHLEKYGKKVGNKWEINLSQYKILGVGDVKTKMIIIAKEASKSAFKKIEKSGGEIKLVGKVDKEKPISKNKEE